MRLDCSKPVLHKGGLPTPSQLHPMLSSSALAQISLLCTTPLTVSCPVTLLLIFPQPQTPHLEEDLKEVLRSEAGIELIIEDDVKPEKQKRKQGVSLFSYSCCHAALLHVG